MGELRSEHLGATDRVAQHGLIDDRIELQEIVGIRQPTLADESQLHLGFALLVSACHR